MTRRKLLAAFLAIGIGAAMPAAAKPPVDWTTTLSRTADGAFVLGNPDARVKIIEYLSLTCSHCAHFTAAAYGPLKAGYIKTGKVSLEIRHAVRDGFDLTAALLSRCDGPARYFPASEAVFAAQPEWLERAGKWAEATGDIDSGPLNARLAAHAKGSGLDLLFRKRGMSPIKMAACLANKPEQERLSKMADEAWNGRKIGGTPAFLINGVLQEGVFDWGALEPRIKAALK